MFLIVEAVRQLRGEGTARQVRGRRGRAVSRHRRHALDRRDRSCSGRTRREPAAAGSAARGREAAPRADPDFESAPFWAATLEDRLVVQHCTSCDHRQLYGRSRCTNCHADTLEWIDVSGLRHRLQPHGHPAEPDAVVPPSPAARRRARRPRRGAADDDQRRRQRPGRRRDRRPRACACSSRRPTTPRCRCSNSSRAMSACRRSASGCCSTSRSTTAATASRRRSSSGSRRRRSIAGRARARARRGTAWRHGLRRRAEVRRRSIEQGVLAIVGPSISDNGLIVRGLADAAGLAVHQLHGRRDHPQRVHVPLPGRLARRGAGCPRRSPAVAGIDRVAVVHDRSPVGRHYADWFELARATARHRRDGGRRASRRSPTTQPMLRRSRLAASKPDGARVPRSRRRRAHGRARGRRASAGTFPSSPTRR